MCGWVYVKLQKCVITAAVRENNLSNWSDFTAAVNQFKWSCTQFIRTAEFVGQILFQHVIENFAELQMKKHLVELIIKSEIIILKFLSAMQLDNILL